MVSTYSALKVELMTTGENNTTWGDITNVNLGTALEEAIVGSANVVFADANQTLSLVDTNASQTARNMRLNLTGSATAGYNLIVPAIKKPYIINNATDGTITVKNATGTGIAVPSGTTTWVYNTGVNVVDTMNYANALSAGTLAASGGTAGTVFGGFGVYNAAGAGTADSAARLYLSGSNTNTRAAFLEGLNSGGSDNAHDMVFGVSDASSAPVERMRLTGVGGYLILGDGPAWDTGLVQSNGSIGVGTFTANSNGHNLRFTKSRQTTPGTHDYANPLQSGDNLGSVQFYGDDGYSYLNAASVYGEVDGSSTGVGDMPGRLTFYTRSDGTSGTSAERMRITAAGNVGIGCTPSSSYRLDVQETGDVTSRVKSIVSTVGAADSAKFAIDSAGTGTATLSMRRDGTEGGYVEWTSSNALNIATTSTNTVTLGTNGVARLTIDGTTGATSFSRPVTFNDVVTVANTGSGTALQVTSTDAGATAAPDISFYRNSASPAVSDTLGILLWDGNNDAAASVTYAQISATAKAVTATTESGMMTLAVRKAGTATSFVTLDGSTNLVTLTNAAGLSIARTAVTSPAATDGNVYSGTYTPTLTAVTNVAATVSDVCTYMRVGNTVTVSGLIQIDPTATGAIEVGVSLPVASNFNATSQAVGTVSDSAATIVGLVASDATNDRMSLLANATTTANRNVAFHATYRVI
jgi:hypothetical protein